MQKAKLSAAVIFSGLLFTSCEKNNSLELGADATPSCKLCIKTRGEDGATTAIKSGRIYIFDEEGTCVQLLTTDETTHKAEADLNEGTFDIYAIGGSDLSCFSLPSQEEATSTSIIALKDGETMGDLLLKHEVVTLEKNQDQELSLLLDRKVISINNITINQVPADVTDVSVSISPLYKEIQLDGKFTDKTGDYQISLNKQSDGTTWQAKPCAYSFPSKNKPTIVINFKTGSDVKSFAFKGSEALMANHGLEINATYSESQGVKLTTTLTGVAWGDTQSITFDFNDDNATTTPATSVPVAGQSYKGCYVVTVDEENNKAVLLSPTENTGYTNSSLLTFINNALKSWSAVDGVSGTWRLPTVSECQTFLKDENCIPLSSGSLYYYCLNGKEANSIEVKISGNPKERKVKDPESFQGAKVFLRPVIDIKY